MTQIARSGSAKPMTFPSQATSDLTRRNERKTTLLTSLLFVT